MDMWKTSIVVVTIGALAACKKEPRNEGTSWLLLGLLAGSSCRPALLGGTMQSSFCSAQLTGEVLTFAGSPAGSSSSGDTDGTGTAARFNNPAGIATDGINLFVSDMANNKIRRIALPSGVVSTLAGPAAGCAGACPAGDTDASGTTARFQSPIGITSDGVYLYVSDFGNNKIRRISIASGSVATFAGPSQGTTTSGDADGGSSAARFSSPYGLTTDGTDLFVSDFSSHKIRRINLANGTTSTLAGPAAGCSPACPSGDTDGTGAAARFNNPTGLTTDGVYLYVADSANRKIRRVHIATGQVTTLSGPAAGTTTAGDVQGAGNAARFNNPRGVTSDGRYLYVGDMSNNKLRRVGLSDGDSRTLAGPAEGSTASGSADGTGSAASFNAPQSSASDGSSLYLVDIGNHKIRRVR